MKTKSYINIGAMVILSLFFAGAFDCAQANPNAAGIVAGNPLNGIGSRRPDYEGAAQQEAEAARQKKEYEEQQAQSLQTLQQHLADLKNNNSDGLFRTVRGVTNCIYNMSGGWREISGRVLQVLPDGIIVSQGDGQDCFVKAYPNEAVDGISIADCWAKTDGVYQYTTIMGSTRTIKCYNYGINVAASPEMQEKAIKILEHEIEINPIVLKAKADAAIRQKSAETKAKQFKEDQESADRGEERGLLRMAKRYESGDMVEKDIDKCLEYLEKAADGGSMFAQRELKRLKAK